MPPLYEAPIPMWNPKKNQREIQPLAFMLPHELLWAMANWNSSEVSSHKLFAWANGLREDLRSKLEHETAKLDLPEDKVVAMGVWVDGVPTKFDRSESLECFSLSFPHLETSAENKHIRLPLTLLNKSFFLKSGETIHAIFKILCWSFHACLQNYFPTVDEHGHEHTSNWRRKKAGEELGAFGLLLEIRGDWLCYKQTFGLPNWAEKSCRCCWRLPLYDPTYERSWHRGHLAPTTFHLGGVVHVRAGKAGQGLYIPSVLVSQLSMPHPS